MKRLVTYLAALSLGACVTLPPDAFVVSPQDLERRQLESRRFSGLSEAEILTASANVLQDLGFGIAESETKLGVIVASKDRDATEAGEIVLAVIVALLGGGAMPISKDQTIRVSLVVRAVAGDSSGKDHVVRVTFQRIVRKTDNSIFVQSLQDPELYTGFFDRLSKAVFLEAQKI